MNKNTTNLKTSMQRCVPCVMLFAVQYPVDFRMDNSRQSETRLTL